MGLVRESEDDSIDVEQLDPPPELVGTAEQCQMIEVLTPFLRSNVDETNEIEAVLWMLEDLPGDKLPDIAGADDDGVLQVHDAPPRHHACDRARDEDEDDRECPEHD